MTWLTVHVRARTSFIGSVFNVPSCAAAEEGASQKNMKEQSELKGRNTEKTENSKNSGHTRYRLLELMLMLLTLYFTVICFLVDDSRLNLVICSCQFKIISSFLKIPSQLCVSPWLSRGRTRARALLSMPRCPAFTDLKSDNKFTGKPINHQSQAYRTAYFKWLAFKLSPYID